ncbi:DUF4263 domain-containing protein [bacterium]|nr:MAG: DUF4263 domain-containing protein [bacterium]
MDEKYHVKVTSRDSAEVDDIPLTPPEDDKGTRRIIRPMIINNAHEAAASVQIELIHQRRHKKSEPWEDAEKFNLATLKSGEEVRFNLTAVEAWRLKETLNQLFAIGQNGVPRQSTDFIAVPAQLMEQSQLVKGGPKEVLQKLQAEHGAEFLAALQELNLGPVEVVEPGDIYEKRRKAVDSFRKALASGKGNEGHWRKFLNENEWVFGDGLNYHIEDLSNRDTWNNLAGADNLAESPIEFRDVLPFTIFVGLKSPKSPLIEPIVAAPGAYSIGADVTSGVALLQSFARTVNESLEAGQAEPKIVLLIGNRAEFSGAEPIKAFENFRRNLRAPEILTYDELLARAEFIAGRAAPRSSKSI